MLDKNILEKWDACYKKAEEIVGFSFGREHTESVLNVANLLVEMDYVGVRLDMQGNIARLKNSEEGYIHAGLPSFLGLFGRDSLITAWQLLDYDPIIARNTLVSLQKRQGRKKNEDTGEEPGKILHEYYPEGTSNTWWAQHKKNFDWLTPGVPNYMSVDSTLLYLILAAEYVQRTQDYVFYEGMYQSFLDAMQWAINYGLNDNGFVCYGHNDTKKIGWGLQNQSWKDSGSYHIIPPVSMVEVQGYLYAAISKMAELDGNSSPPVITNFKRDFNKHFWMKDMRYYAMALDGDGEQNREITSNPGHLLFTGILPRSREKLVVKKLFSDEMWTPYGIRTHSTVSKLFDQCSYHLGSVWPFDNWVIAQGLKQAGFDHEYNQVKHAMYRAYNELGYIPEYYGVSLNHKILRLPACHPQAWSSGALLNFALEDGK